MCDVDVLTVSALLFLIKNSNFPRNDNFFLRRRGELFGGKYSGRGELFGLPNYIACPLSFVGPISVAGGGGLPGSNVPNNVAPPFYIQNNENALKKGS